MAIQARDLDVTSLLADVRIGERTHGVCLLERALVHVVVEDHRYAETANLDLQTGWICKDKTQSQLAVLHSPRAYNFQRNRVGERTSQVGRRQNIFRMSDRFHGQSVKGCRVVFPVAASDAQS